MRIIDMQATGNIAIFDGNTIASNANIRLVADETLTIGAIQANGASVSLTANNIIDSGTDDLDILAKELMIQSLQGVGTIGKSAVKLGRILIINYFSSILSILFFFNKLN